MLSIGAMGGGQAAYYVDLAREDYYRQGGEPLGTWYGRGTQDAELVGVVAARALNRLFDGFHPTTNRALIQNAGAKDHQPGWDLTFSAPKSVSALWSQADPETRLVIQQAHQAAVKAALSYLESEVAITRRGKGGHLKEAAHLFIAVFEHGTSRAMDPQLHTHCLVLNVCTREDGTSGTIESKPLYEAKMITGALYRAELAAQLTQHMNLTAERKGSFFEIQGVPTSLLTALSKRRAEIEELLESKGYDSPEAAAVAALLTRGVKGHVPREELFATWQETGRSLGWGPEEAAKLLQEAQAPKRNVEAEKAKALSLVTFRMTEQKSYFTRRDFLRGLAEEAQGRGLGASTVLSSGVAHLTGGGECVALGKHQGEEIYTTREVLALEKKLLTQVEASREQSSPGVSETVLDGVLASRQKLLPEQREVLHYLCADGLGNVRVVSNVGSTSKETLLDAARFAWTLEGFEVHGAARSAQAVHGLREGALIESQSLHRTLGDLEKGKLRLNARSILVVDEADRIETRQMERLVEWTQRAGARLVLVEDAGNAGLLHSRTEDNPLSEIKRRLSAATLTGMVWPLEQGSDDRKFHFSGGPTQKRLIEYANRGVLSVLEDQNSASAALIAAWKREGVRTPHEHLIFAETSQGVSTLNHLAQAERIKAGALGQTESVLTPDGNERLYEGDRVQFTRKSRLYGVENGNLGTIVAVDVPKKIIGVRLDTDERVSVPLDSFPHVRLGYALTTHRGHEASFERAFVLAGGALQHNEVTYVHATRAQKDVHVFCDPETAGTDLTQLLRQRSTSRSPNVTPVFVVPQTHPEPEHTRQRLAIHPSF